nr:hypothetical protein Iba_chr07eCG5810 [Ipomoea batatas]
MDEDPARLDASLCDLDCCSFAELSIVTSNTCAAGVGTSMALGVRTPWSGAVNSYVNPRLKLGMPLIVVARIAAFSTRSSTSMLSGSSQKASSYSEELGIDDCGLTALLEGGLFIPVCITPLIRSAASASLMKLVSPWARSRCWCTIPTTLVTPERSYAIALSKSLENPYKAKKASFELLSLETKRSPSSDANASPYSSRIVLSAVVQTAGV